MLQLRNTEKSTRESVKMSVHKQTSVLHENVLVNMQQNIPTESRAHIGITPALPGTYTPRVQAMLSTSDKQHSRHRRRRNKSGKV